MYITKGVQFEKKIIFGIYFFVFFFQNSSTALLIATCLFASVYSTLGMKTVYYRNGEVCDVCADEHSGTSYRRGDGDVQRVVYRQRYIDRDDSTYYSSSKLLFLNTHLILFKQITY